ncbi:MAG: hypothetical protein JO222_02520 [Frankiales bacterium]|nr:hypothetical protein [Frankiales bacterium]
MARSLRMAVRLATVADHCENAVQTLRSWNVRAAFLPFWFQEIGKRLHPEDEALVVLEYDDGLLSFDAWVRDRRLFGADDYVG